MRLRKGAHLSRGGLETMDDIDAAPEEWKGVVTDQTPGHHLPGVRRKGTALTCLAGLAGPPRTAGIERPEWVCSALSPPLILLPGTGFPQAVG